MEEVRIELGSLQGSEMIIPQPEPSEAPVAKQHLAEIERGAGRPKREERPRAAGKKRAVFRGGGGEGPRGGCEARASSPSAIWSRVSQKGRSRSCSRALQRQRQAPKSGGGSSTISRRPMRRSGTGRRPSKPCWPSRARCRSFGTSGYGFGTYETVMTPAGGPLAEFRPLRRMMPGGLQ